MSTDNSLSEKRQSRRDLTINVRVSASTRDLIDNAASLVGKSRSEFLIESARREAFDVLLDQRLFSLPGADYDAFVKALDAPAAPPRKLKSLFRDKAPWE